MKKNIYDQMKDEAQELINRINKYQSKKQEYPSRDRSSVKRQTLELSQLMSDYRNRRYTED